MSTSCLLTNSRASSSLADIVFSTALHARSVAIAVWSAEANRFETLSVVGRASVMTRIRRSP